MSYSARAETNALAIISFVAGLTSWFIVPLLGGIVAIVTGHMARSEIRQNAMQSGDGLALAGLVLGYLNLLVSCVLPLLIFGGVISLGGILAVCGSISEGIEASGGVIPPLPFG